MAPAGSCSRPQQRRPYRPASLPPPRVQVVQAGGRAGMLLTTASVQSGASGGAVLDPGSGRLLGLVTSNAKHASGTL